VASSRLIIDSPPVEDPRSLIKRVTVRFLLDAKLEQSSGVICNDRTKMLEIDEFSIIKTSL